MAISTRTLNPLHFEDLEPKRFEDLVRQLAYGMKNWRTLEATGRLGADEGLDIRGIELVNPDMYPDTGNDEGEEVNDTQLEERTWVIQCKRHRRVYPKQIAEIVEKAVPLGSEAPFGLIIAVACDVSRKAFDSFSQKASGRGLQEFDIWTRSRLEDFLFQPRFDHLLFAYFNISLRSRRISRLIDIRHRLTIKRKLLRVFEQYHGLEVNIRTPLFQPVLVRDLEDDRYPDEESISSSLLNSVRPWQTVQAHRLYSRGLIVLSGFYPGWVKSSGEWDIADTSPNLLRGRLEMHLPWNHQNRDHVAEQQATAQKRSLVPENEYKEIQVARLLPYDSIQEVDIHGDPLNNIPHLYCSFHPTHGPYEESPLYFYRENRDEVRLDLAQRKELFKNG